jgi:ketosteroid isomerase-like protein
MKKITLSVLMSLLFQFSFSQKAEDSRIDSIKKVIQARYEELAIKYDLRNLDTMLSFRTKDFRIVGPTGNVQDYPMAVEHAKYFLTNNIPPYHIKNTVEKIRVSPNNLIVVADVLQESVRKRELAGKLRDVKVIAKQTETWVNHDGKWLLQIVENIHGRKRYVDGKRVSDDPNALYDPNAPEYTDPLEREQRNSTGTIAGVKLSTKDSKIIKQVETQQHKMIEAFSKDDMQGVASYYTDDAKIVSGRNDFSGRGQIDQFWLSLKGRGKSWKLITNSIEVNRDIAFHDGISVLTFLQNGKEVESRTRFLVVWKRQKDGSWKISKDYYSEYL